MKDYPIALHALVDWLNSKALGLGNTSVSFAGTQQNALHLPSAFADFDAERVVGRICGWISGEIDFEIVRISDGKMIFFQHVKVSSIEDPTLDGAYSKFLKNMTLAPESL